MAPFWNEMKGFFKKKNPFWSHAECQLFIARKQGKVIGRIAAIIDHAYCQAAREKIGYFGFFECIEDYRTAQALFQVAQDWLVSKNIKIMRGPIDGRIDVGCGFLYTGFDSPPSVLSTYSPAYYLSFAEKYGMKKSRDFFHYSIDLTKPLPKKLEEKAHQCLSAGIQIRPFNRFRTGREMKWWVPLFLETFEDHWGFVPVSSQEVYTRFGVKHLRWFVDPRLFLVAESNDEPVAYLWSTPDYNTVFQTLHGKLGPSEAIRFLLTQRRIHTGKLHFVGIRKEFRHHHIASLLNYKALLEMKNRGYVRAEVGYMDEHNTIAHTTIALTGATVYKKHRVFEKDLTT
ncbi:MAG TPA: GNAT family N-acetyltransferase [Candidatus Thermoplasmatota archaeon]|nr:GNAT family N-acetyltransferase [Candidatus Thermoplasmatota archaeon]